MIKYFDDLTQGTPEWFAARCGLLTASEMDKIITPKKLEFSNSDTMRKHAYELAAQRINQYVEPTYVSDKMLRGKEEEERIRKCYSEKYAPVKQVGFVTNDKWGFTLGVSPDGLVGEDGTIEGKSRDQKFQVEQICTDEMDVEFRLQVQTALLVTERKWCDFVSFNNGMPMFTKRILPDHAVQDAILQAATQFHTLLDATLKKYADQVAALGDRLIPTERIVYEEGTGMMVGETT